MNIKSIDRMAIIWLAAAGYVIALLMGILYWQQDRLLQQEIRQSREQFKTIHSLRIDNMHNEEAAKECEIRSGLQPNQ